MNKNQYRLKTQIYIYILKEDYSYLKFLSKCPCKITISIIGQSLPAISFQNMTLNQSKQKRPGVEKHYIILR